MLGIIIGVAAVIAMLSIGSGARFLMEQRIQTLGTNAVYVWPGWKKSTSRGGEERSMKLTVEDWKAVERLPEVASAAPMVFSYGDLIYGTNNWSCMCYGTTATYAEQRSLELKSGRMFNSREVQSGENVIVLGSNPNRELFGAADAVGTTIRFKNLPFKVIGVLPESGSRDDMVLIPYTTLMKKVDRGDSLGYLSLSARSREEVKELERKVIAFLNLRANIEDPDNGGFEAFNQAEVSEKADESTRIFSMLLGGIASISLLVGGIGIMNIMLVSVTERTREIGIRMSVGARGRDILAQFLVEAIALSVLGGLLGVLFGFGISSVIARFAGWPTIVSTGSIVLSFGTSVVIGVFFGFYPAYSASKLDPIQALRHE